MAADEHPAALKTWRASALVEPAKNERSCAFRDPFDSPALDTLGIARLTGSSTAGDDDAEDRKNERKRAEYEILPPALRGEVRERANRHRDGEEPSSPPEQRRVASSAQDPRAAEQDQRGGGIEDDCGCACASLRR